MNTGNNKIKHGSRDLRERNVNLPVATIDTLAFGGNGVCRLDGKVCFVPFSCPGDEVSLRMTSNKKSYCTATISEIVSPSNARVIPECSIFGICGGCSWQHLSYTVQLLHKRKILTETLWRGARVVPELIEDVLPAASQYHYRNRFQFKAALQNGRLCIGFFRHGSHKVEDAVYGCPVALPSINKVLSYLRGILPSYPAAKSITQITIDAGDNGVVAIIHQDGSVTSKNRDYFIERAADCALCTGLFLKGRHSSDLIKVWGAPVLSYHMVQADTGMQPLIITYPAGGFAQVHQQQNRSILSTIRRVAGFKGSERLLDLYCGNGNFSLPLAAEVGSVLGIEGNAGSIRAAEYNAKLNSVANARFICNDVTSAVCTLLEQGVQFETVLLDPPRSGAGEAVAGIARLQPNKIIYVSCDPSTLARDCQLLKDFGFSVVTSVPVDMFPQTFHIESVTLLQKEKGFL